MRVCLLTHYYEPENGAPQRRWGAFVAALQRAGHEVTVVTAVPHYPHGRATPGGPGRGRQVGRYGETVVRVGLVPYDGRRGRRLLDQLWVALRSLAPAVRSRPDVVVATAPGLPSLVVGRAVASLRRVPLVVEMRDAWPDLLAHLGLPAPARAVAGRLVTALQRSAAVVVCVSGEFGRRLQTRGMRRVVHLPNGVDVAAVPPLPPREAGPGPMEVLYAGTVGESQRVEQAVRAVGLLPPGTVRLTVVGVGAGLDTVVREAASLPDPAAVRVLPATDPAGVRELLARSDSALVCLRDWPPFAWTVPSKLYELMASARHVTAAVTGETAAVVRAAAAGDVVAPEDPAALAGLWAGLSRDRSRLAVGDAPRRWVGEHADVPAVSRQLVDLLEGLAADRGDGR